MTDAADRCARRALAEQLGLWGDALRARRTAARMSRRLLARRAGLSRNTVFLLERGRHAPLPDTLRRLCRALKISPPPAVRGGRDVR